MFQISPKFTRRTIRIISLTFLLLLFAVIILMPAFHPAFGQTNENTFQIDFATLGYSTRSLEGPRDSTTYRFSLPADWIPQEDSAVEFDVSYSVESLLNAEVSPEALFEVYFNNNLLYTEDINTSSPTSSLRVEIPTDTFRLAEDRFTNELNLRLLLADQCEEGHEVEVTIGPSSILDLTYQERSIPLDLSNLPKPFFQLNAFFGISPTHIILPPDPQVEELRLMGIVAASIGKQTRDNLPIQVNLNNTLPTTVTERNLILIGSPERMSLLSDLDLPASLQERQLTLSSQMPSTVTLDQPFSYTLIVENTSTDNQELILEDRLSSLIVFESCEECEELAPGLLRWELGNLEPGETMSTVVRVRPNRSADLGEMLDHTATLLNADDQAINVDTLAVSIGPEPGQTTISSPPKGPFFFTVDGQAVPETDGIIQLVESPWSSQRAVLVVTGLDETALLRASQSLAAENRILEMVGQYALIQATQPISDDEELSEQDISFSDLGYGDIVKTGRSGVTAVGFNVPRGGELLEEAYLMLHMAHGTTMEAISASLEVSLNNAPIHSIALKDDNANDQWIKIELPERRLRSAYNQLELDVVADWPECLTTEEESRLWTTIYADSFVHLPFRLPGDRVILDLDDFPNFLFTEPDLGDVTLLTPEQITVDEIQGLADFFSVMGDTTQADNFAFQVAVGNQATLEQWDNHHLVIVGQPSRNSFIDSFNAELPQPFIFGRDEIKQQIDNVIYRLTPGYDLGYLQLLSSPANRNKALLFVTGTTEEGVQWALNSLSDQSLRSQLEGNLAALVETEDLRAVDTRSQSASRASINRSLLDENPAFLAEATTTPTVMPTATPAPVSTVSTLVLSDPVIEPVTTTIDSALERRSLPRSTILVLALGSLTLIGALGILFWQRRF